MENILSELFCLDYNSIKQVLIEYIEFTKELLLNHELIDNKLNELYLKHKAALPQKLASKATLTKKKPPPHKAKNNKQNKLNPYLPFPIKAYFNPYRTINDANENDIPSIILLANKFVNKSININCYVKEFMYDSVYSNDSIKYFDQYFNNATKLTNIDKWFKRVNKVEIEEKKLTLNKVKRISCIPYIYSQRICILIHALKKNFDKTYTVYHILQKIINMEYSKEEYSLLSESLISIQQNSELANSMNQIKSMLLNQELLYDDEIFLYVTNQIPQFKEKMKCLYLNLNYKNISDLLISRFKTIIDAIICIANNNKVNLVFQIILRLCNIVLTNHGIEYTHINPDYIRKLNDIKCLNGVTLLDYISAYIPPMFSETQMKLLTKANSYGISSTYLAARDLIKSFILMKESLNTSSEENECPNNSKVSTKCTFNIVDQNDQLNNQSVVANESFIKAFENNYTIVTSKQLDDIEISFKNLVDIFTEFSVKYILLCYYFGNPQLYLHLINGKTESSTTNEEQAKYNIVEIVEMMTTSLSLVLNSIKASINVRNYDENIIEGNNVSSHVNKSISNYTYVFTSPKSQSSSIINIGETPTNSLIPTYRRPLLIRNRFGIKTGIKRSKPSFPPGNDYKKTSIDNSYSFARNIT